MGMGLSICRPIIEGHDGRLWFDPNKPEGANFRFKLLAENTMSADVLRENQIQQT
jgi:K+-sensing histidine kinase KdpD